MNRIELPKGRANKRRKRVPPAQIELTLPLPLPSSRPSDSPDAEAERPQTERGIAVVDFYI